MWLVSFMLDREDSFFFNLFIYGIITYYAKTSSSPGTKST